MRRIVVGIPTLDEAATIGHVARTADDGLRLVERRFGPIRAEIVNADSESADGTARIFSAQPTSFPKRQVSTGGPPGKGKNVRKLLDAAAAFDADCLVLLDGDLRSVRPEWVPALAGPVLAGGVDFVLPRYRRNRFEGAITNHFCVPLVYSIYGRYVRQPIGGDFALSRRLVELVREADWPPTAQHYGVDITLTITALRASRPWAEADLDRKVHKPVFAEKFCWVFAEVCEAALRLLRGAAVAPRAEAIAPAAESFDDDLAFPFDQTIETLLEIADRRLGESRTARALERHPIGPAVRRMVEDAKSGVPLAAGGYSSLWCEAMTAAARAAIAGAHEARATAALLLPAFLVKMCSFWAEVRAAAPQRVEAEVVRLAEEARRSLAPALVPAPD